MHHCHRLVQSGWMHHCHRLVQSGKGVIPGPGIGGFEYLGGWGRSTWKRVVGLPWGIEVGGPIESNTTIVWMHHACYLFLNRASNHQEGLLNANFCFGACFCKLDAIFLRQPLTLLLRYHPLVIHIALIAQNHLLHIITCLVLFDVSVAYIKKNYSSCFLWPKIGKNAQPSLSW